MCLDQVKWTWSTVNVWTCRWFYIGFRSWLFKPTLLSWADRRVVRSFPALHFDVTKVSGVMDKTPEAHVQITEEMHVDCNHFCYGLFLSLWDEIFMTFCSVLYKHLFLFFCFMQVHEKMSLVTKHAKRSTHCTFWYPFASNSVIYLSSSLSLCVDADVGETIAGH